MLVRNLDQQELQGSADRDLAEEIIPSPLKVSRSGKIWNQSFESWEIRHPRTLQRTSFPLPRCLHSGV